MERWYKGDSAREMKVYLQRATGVLWYGVLPVIAFTLWTDTPLEEFGLRLSWGLGETTYAIVLLPLAFVAARLSAPKPDGWEIYPEVRTPEWTSGTLLRSAFWWTIYFLAYEIIFRGFLLFASLKIMGIGGAIVLNMAFNGLTHVAKSLKETVGAMLMALILCPIVLHTGTIWVAFLAHVTLSLSNEWLTLRYHPEIGMRRRGRE